MESSCSKDVVRRGFGFIQRFRRSADLFRQLWTAIGVIIRGFELISEDPFKQQFGIVRRISNCTVTLK